MSSPVQSVDVVRVAGGVGGPVRDVAASEEPLEIRLHGAPFVVTMRTPGADRELAAGFLLSERIIREADDLGTIRHCADAGSAGGGQRAECDAHGRGVGKGGARARQAPARDDQQRVRRVRAPIRG